MKTYEEMAESALGRIGIYKDERARKIKAVKKIAIPSISLCLAVIVCTFAFRSGFSNTKSKANNISLDKDTAIIEDESETYADYIKSNDAKNTEGDSGATVSKSDEEIQTEESCLFWWKNKLLMGGALYNEIQNNPNGKYVISASFHPVTSEITSFTYEGETLAELAVASEEEKNMPEKMAQLLKEGDSLKYGEALYKEGAPNGERWDKSLYEERVSFYGKELLQKYIVNGEFLSEKLSNDIKEYNEQSAAKKYKSAYYAYLDTVLKSAAEKINKLGIKCETNKNRIAFTVTADELENLPLDDIEYWRFNLDSDSLKSDENHITDGAANETVN